MPRMIAAFELMQEICDRPAMATLLRPAVHRADGRLRGGAAGPHRPHGLPDISPGRHLRDRLGPLTPTCASSGWRAFASVDASVMPVVPRGNTNAPTIAIAERAADLIKGMTPLQPLKSRPPAYSPRQAWLDPLPYAASEQHPAEDRRDPRRSSLRSIRSHGPQFVATGRASHHAGDRPKLGAAPIAGDAGHQVGDPEPCGNECQGPQSYSAGAWRAPKAPASARKPRPRLRAPGGPGESICALSLRLQLGPRQRRPRQLRRKQLCVSGIRIPSLAFSVALAVYHLK